MAESSSRFDIRNWLVPIITVMLIAATGFIVGFALTIFSLQALILAGVPVQEYPTLLIAISVLMLQGVGFGSVGLGYLYVSDYGFGLLNVRWPGVRDFIWFLAGLIGLFVLLISVNVVLMVVGIETAQHELVGIGLENPEILLVLIPLSIILVGPGEELLFRGVIQQLLRERFGAWFAIILASVIFAIAHVGALTGDGLLPTLIIYFVLSILLGAVYEYSGNLVVPALIHGVFNAIQFLLLYVIATYDMLPALVSLFLL